MASPVFSGCACHSSRLQIHNLSGDPFTHASQRSDRGVEWSFSNKKVGGSIPTLPHLCVLGKILNPLVLRASATGFGLGAPGFGLRAPGFGLRAPGFGLRAPGYELLAPGLWAPGFALQALAPGPRLRAPGSGLRASGFGARATSFWASAFGPGSGSGPGLRAFGFRLRPRAPGSGPGLRAFGFRLQALAPGPRLWAPGSVLRAPGYELLASGFRLRWRLLNQMKSGRAVDNSHTSPPFCCALAPSIAVRKKPSERPPCRQPGEPHSNYCETTTRWDLDVQSLPWQIGAPSENLRLDEERRRKRRQRREEEEEEKEEEENNEEEEDEEEEKKEDPGPPPDLDLGPGSKNRLTGIDSTIHTYARLIEQIRGERGGRAAPEQPHVTEGGDHEVERSRKQEREQTEAAAMSRFILTVGGSLAPAGGLVPVKLEMNQQLNVLVCRCWFCSWKQREKRNSRDAAAESHLFPRLTTITANCVPQ
ncbi:unnamed protein product [Pleuronectes platessa]|uniref:Uncharacterized protein n=1 Tax=Pleuronectes platessa TaxID=8262 RepID=A0A9N7YUZ8_PLEPL|nr:unnamed protein product [Pleuronectes platessa]